VNITDGLVGFLSGNFSDEKWKDEYLGVNATVKGVAEMTDNGLKFEGVWAEWPVGSQGENQLYHFANYNFTLVATVSIHGVPKERNPIPLIGVKMNDGDSNPVLLGLSYNKEKQWQVSCGDQATEKHSSTWEPETRHQVAIVLQNSSQGSVYVDGKRVWNGPCALEITDLRNISHFYIGGDGGSKDNTGRKEVSVTVRNVLLYNRPLTEEEIGALNQHKDPITLPVTENAQKTMLQSPVTPQPSGMEQLKGVGSAGGGSEAGAASTAATPSSDVTQTVATETEDTKRGNGSPQTPEVSLSSGENGEETGGTDGRGEGIQPQDRKVNATALNSSLGNSSQGHNTDAGTMRGSALLPLLLLLLGLWGFAAL
ncbi:trans-sialidase, putative, partial [Trypanosoma cruzi marinkellei]